jgi:DNA-binding MarR family transcriptional regulator
MLAATLGMVPSRLVALVDDMEARGLIERRENTDDRRRYALHVTEKGRSMLETIGRVSREHSRTLFAALSEDEKRQLATLLQRVADEQGLCSRCPTRSDEQMVQLYSHATQCNSI